MQNAGRAVSRSLIGGAGPCTKLSVQWSEDVIRGAGTSVVDRVLRIRGDATRTHALPACTTLDHATHVPNLQWLAPDHCPVLFFCGPRALAAKARRSTRITLRLDLLHRRQTREAYQLDERTRAHAALAPDVPRVIRHAQIARTLGSGTPQPRHPGIRGSVQDGCCQGSCSGGVRGSSCTGACGCNTGGARINGSCTCGASS